MHLNNSVNFDHVDFQVLMWNQKIVGLNPTGVSF